MDASSNWTLKEYLENRLGPQHLHPAVVVPITVVYVLIFTSGVIGNAVVCLVIARNSHFQTPTNYYLFSLAISDLMILILGLPNDLKVFWQQYPWAFGEVICRLRAYIAEMTSNASVLTIVAFTTERYIAICHPLFIQKMSTLSRAIKIISSVWILACTSAIPFAVYTKINYLDYPESSGHFVEESGLCTLPMDNNDITFPLLHFSTIVFFCLPMTIIIILYIKIGLRLRQSRFSRISSDDSARYSPSAGNCRQNVVRKSVHRMLVAVVIAFFICWAPFHAQRLLTANVVRQKDWTAELRRLNEVLYYSAGCFYYFSATINPILYSLLSAKYRIAFREALCAFSTAKREGRSHSRYPNRYSTSFVGNSERQHSVRESPVSPVNGDRNCVKDDSGTGKLNGYITNASPVQEILPRIEEECKETSV